MKKSFLFLTCTFICYGVVVAQKIKYESSIEKAKIIALQQQKPIAILITINPPVPTPDFLKGLSDQAVIEKFNTNFINYKVAREDTAASRKIISEYKINSFPSLIFLDFKGGMMFTGIAFLSRATALLEMADKAVAATKEKSLIDYDSIYNAGNRRTDFLKEYITKRKSTGISDNADLIEKYVSGLRISDLDNYGEVLFILKAGPLADSNAYKLARTNKRIVDSIFKMEPLDTRVAMNNATINNTMRKAIADKNYARAVAAANFARGTWINDFNEAQKTWQLKMLQYYLGVKDTASYLQNAVSYYEQYFMRMSIDSVRKKDSLHLVAAKNKAQATTIVNTKDSLVKRTFSFIYAKDNYATELNNAAWNFNNLAGNNNDYLLKAMLWSKRSLEYNPKAGFYDTYAHLLYKLKFYDEAESMQKKAIESGKEEKMDTRLFQKEYDKMKKRIL